MVWTINWGDGTPDVTVRPDTRSLSLQHTYAIPGNYNVTISVSDLDGGKRLKTNCCDRSRRIHSNRQLEIIGTNSSDSVGLVQFGQFIYVVAIYDGTLCNNPIQSRFFFDSIRGSLGDGNDTWFGDGGINKPQFVSAVLGMTCSSEVMKMTS